MAKFREIIVKSINVQAGKYTDINDQLQDFLAHEIYLVPKEDGEHERYVVDRNFIVSKQSSGASGNFIPLSGTESGKNITNHLHFESGAGMISFANNALVQFTNASGGGIITALDFNTNRTTNLIVKSEKVEVQSHPNSEGLTGGIDFSANYTDLSYVQKGYVDDKIQSARIPLTANAGNPVGEAFFERIGNKVFVHFDITAIDIPSGGFVHFKDANNTQFLNTDKIIRLLNGTELHVKTYDLSAGISLMNNGDTNTFEIHDTFVYYISESVPV